MADISDINAALPIKIVGSSSTGLESTPVNSNANGNILSADILNISSAQTTLSVGTGASVECKVGGSTLANRKFLIIQAQGTNITYGFASGSQPFTLGNGATITFALGPSVSVWVRRSGGAGSVNVAIAEIS